MSKAPAQSPTPDIQSSHVICDIIQKILNMRCVFYSDRFSAILYGTHRQFYPPKVTRQYVGVGLQIHSLLPKLVDINVRTTTICIVAFTQASNAHHIVLLNFNLALWR